MDLSSSSGKNEETPDLVDRSITILWTSTDRQ
jgi:hypothetical protein